MWRYIVLYQIKCYYYLNNRKRPTTVVRYSRTPLFVFRKQDQKPEQNEEVELEDESYIDSMFRGLGMIE